MKMNVAITGSRGLIGSHLKKKLLENDMNVTEWDLRTDPPTSAKDFEPRGIDYAVHLAAYANVRQSIEDPQKYWKNNVELTKSIQKICHYNNIPLMYASSSCIHKWWLSPYGTTKKVNEATAFDKQVALRFTTVYGEGARDTMFIPKLLEHKVEYVTEHIRDFIHVDDVVNAICRLLEDMHPQGKTLLPAYDIGTGKGHRPRDLAELAGHPDLPVKKGEPCEADDNTADNSELLKLGWKPKIDVQDYIIKKTIPH
tara:strand:- start:277 stop:1041 length:765 start_codon:yes stop_codon:yes gene_type:complete